MLVEHDRFVRRGNVAAGLGNACFRLTNCVDRFEPGVVTGLDEFQRLTANVERGFEVVALRIKRGKVRINGRDAGRQEQARFIEAEARCVRVLARGAERGAVLAEQVEVEVEAEPSLTVTVTSAFPVWLATG